MVFAINPGSQFAAFQNAAKGITATTSASAVATTATAPSTPAAAPTGTSAVSSDHVITVGGPGRLIFDPSNITAQIGDTITFRFLQKNHTATQSTFDNPCRSLTSTSTSGQVGFDSGL
jgi:plastocyanin